MTQDRLRILDDLDRLRRANNAGEGWRSGLLKGEVAQLIDEVERLRMAEAK